MVIRVADFRQHQVCVKTIVGGTRGGFSRRARGRAGPARDTAGGSLACFIFATRGNEGFVSSLVMIDGNFVLALDQVEIAECVLRRGNSARILGLSEKIQSSLEIAERLIGMALLEQRATATQRWVWISLWFDDC